MFKMIGQLGKSSLAWKQLVVSSQTKMLLVRFALAMKIVLRSCDRQKWESSGLIDWNLFCSGLKKVCWTLDSPAILGIVGSPSFSCMKICTELAW